jgi:hypothetical protein
VKSLKKIGYILIAFVYLFLSTGVALVKTNCLCSDSSNISFYDISDSNSEIITHSICCGETLPISKNNDDNEHAACGCDIPVITYLKLNNHPGSDTKLEYPAGKAYVTGYLPNEIIVNLENVTSEAEIYPYYSPPEKPFGRILISFLHQRKIALIA